MRLLNPTQIKFTGSTISLVILQSMAYSWVPFATVFSIILLGKELYKKTLWTAHGVKLIPAGVDMKKVNKDIEHYLPHHRS